jgi:hypothetical protein
MSFEFSSHEKKKKYLEQLEQRCRHLIRGGRHNMPYILVSFSPFLWARFSFLAFGHFAISVGSLFCISCPNINHRWMVPFQSRSSNSGGLSSLLLGPSPLSCHNLTNVSPVTTNTTVTNPSQCGYCSTDDAFHHSMVRMGKM